MPIHIAFHDLVRQKLKPSLINKSTKKRNISNSFIFDSKIRADTKFKRRCGITKKIKKFDCLTGSNSCLLTLCNKDKFKLYTNEENNPFNKIMP